MKNNIKSYSSSKVVSLEKIDYEALISTMKPSIISFMNNRFIGNYRIYKNNKIAIIESTPVPISDEFKLNIDYLVNQLFGREIIEFIKTLNRKNPNINLTIFNNNQKNVKTYIKKFKLKNILSASKISAYYNPINNAIYMERDGYLLSNNSLSKIK